MIRSKGFMQMFSVSGVGGGSLDFHVDTHDMMSKTDYGKQCEAREESKSHGSSVSTDKDGTQHIYSGGNELASNDSGRSEMDRSNDTSYG